jgi:predicted dehydrogenase
MKMEFIGSTGNLLVDGSHNRTVELQTNKAEYLDTMAYLDIFGVPWGFATESIKHFVAAIDSGSIPRVDGVDGLAVTRLIQAMETSAATDMTVEIDWNPYDTNLALG